MRARGLAVVAIAAAMGLSMPAQAAPCWSQGAKSAAQVREFQAMMMAVALRCAANGTPIHDSYNGFVRANLDKLNAASTTLRQHLGGGEKKAGQIAYDRYTTELSNRYGSGHTNPATCAAFSELGLRATRAAMATSGLDSFAAEMIPQPHSIGELCPMTTAANAVAVPEPTGR